MSSHRPYNPLAGPTLRSVLRAFREKLRRRSRAVPQPDSSETKEIPLPLPRRPLRRDLYETQRLPPVGERGSADETAVQHKVTADGEERVPDGSIDETRLTTGFWEGDTQVIPRQDGEPATGDPADDDTQALPKHAKPELGEPPTWPPLAPPWLQ